MPKKKKQITMLVTVSCPQELTAAQARKEVRTLINEQAFWGHPLENDRDGMVTEYNFRAAKVSAAKSVS